MAASDICLVLLRRSELFKLVLPSKMFEAMAAARPIVSGVEGEARAVLERAGAGIAITPESAEELVDAVNRLAGDAELRGRLARRAVSSWRASSAGPTGRLACCLCSKIRRGTVNLEAIRERMVREGTCES